MNVCCFTGRLGKDCETKFVSAGNGSEVTEFRLAVDVGYGEKKTTMWVGCSGWGKRYAALAPYLLKGQSVGVTGELSNREWTDKAGVTKTSLELRLNDIALLGGKPEAKEGGFRDTPQDDDAGDRIPF